MKQKKPSLSKETIADAAIQCFEKYGPQRTSMADIADEANVSRQSVYRFFEDRSDLIEYILNERITGLAKKLARPFARFATIEECLVEGSLLSIRVARDDALLNQIVLDGRDRSLELFLMRGSDEINTMMLTYWGPALDKARAEGKLRSGMTNEHILGWIRQVHTILMLQDDVAEKVHKRTLQDFLVPSLLVTK